MDEKEEPLPAPRRPRGDTTTSVRWTPDTKENEPPASPRITRTHKDSFGSQLPEGQNEGQANDKAAEAGEEKDTLPPLPISRPNSRPGSRPASSRPTLDSRGTEFSTITTNMPPLKKKETRMMQKEAHPWEHLGITLGLPAILLFDLVIPCIIYYTWYNSHTTTWKRNCREQYPGQHCPIPKPEYDKDILGYAIICFGAGELWILLARIWRLFRHREDCAPLLSRNKWELDATSWVYAVAMLLALIPFVIGSSLVLPHLYLYSPLFLMGFLGILMIVTLGHPFNIPIGINSHARGTRLRPFIYYAAEDFIAVDGLQDREFRERYNERYETNRDFRNMFVYLTAWWFLGVCTYAGCVSAVIWTCEFHIAFGLSLGVLFSYIAVWAGCSYLYVKWEIAREHRKFDEGKYDA